MRTEHISLLLLDNFVFTFKERQDDLLQPILQRIKTGKGRFHSLGPDYLVYTVPRYHHRQFVFAERKSGYRFWIEHTVTSHYCVLWISMS